MSWCLSDCIKNDRRCKATAINFDLKVRQEEKLDETGGERTTIIWIYQLNFITYLQWTDNQHEFGFTVNDFRPCLFCIVKHSNIFLSHLTFITLFNYSIYQFPAWSVNCSAILETAVYTCMISTFHHATIQHEQSVFLAVVVSTHELQILKKKYTQFLYWK